MKIFFRPLKRCFSARLAATKLNDVYLANDQTEFTSNFRDFSESLRQCSPPVSYTDQIRLHVIDEKLNELLSRYFKDIDEDLSVDLFEGLLNLRLSKSVGFYEYLLVRTKYLQVLDISKIVEVLKILHKHKDGILEMLSELEYRLMVEKCYFEMGKNMAQEVESGNLVVDDVLKALEMARGKFRDISLGFFKGEVLKMKTLIKKKYYSQKSYDFLILELERGTKKNK